MCGTGGLAGPAAELTWALVFALTRQVCAEDRRDPGRRLAEGIGLELAGRTLGIIGLGRLGTRVAAVARAFGMEVIAWSENLRRGRAAAPG